MYQLNEPYVFRHERRKREKSHLGLAVLSVAGAWITMYGICKLVEMAYNAGWRGL